MKARAKLFYFFLPVLFAGCDKPDFFRLESISGDSIVAVTDTSTLVMQTRIRDSISSKSLEYELIGTFNDPLFGRTAAISYSTLRLSAETNPGFTTATQFDSLVLSLKYANPFNTIGDLSQVQTWRIYQLDAGPSSGTEYFSNVSFPLGDLLGSFSGSFQSSSGDSFLHINLSNGLLLGNKLVAANGDIFTDNTKFQSFIKGLAIVPDTNISGAGAIIPFNFRSSGTALNLYHSGGELFKMEMSSPAFRVNAYRHNFAGTELNDQLTNPSFNNDKVFLQSMAGTKVFIDIPYLQNLANNYAVNKAEFIFPKASISNDAYEKEQAAVLLMRPVNDDGTVTISFDEALGLAGGTYNSTDASYHFILTKEILFVLNQYRNVPGYKNNGFYLFIPPEKPVEPSRVILSTQKSINTEQPKLILSFSKVEVE